MLMQPPMQGEMNNSHIKMCTPNLAPILYLEHRLIAPNVFAIP
jgi:hypothetical protein